MNIQCYSTIIVNIGFDTAEIEPSKVCYKRQHTLQVPYRRLPHRSPGFLSARPRLETGFVARLAAHPTAMGPASVLMLVPADACWVRSKQY